MKYNVALFIGITVFFSVSVLHATEINAEQKNVNPIDSIWDFDHQLQYKQQVIDDSSWRIEVIRHKNTPFERMATFMFRKAYDLCSNYRFIIEVEDGVELFTDRKAMPNMIFGNLVTKVICLSDNTTSGDPVE